jgi:hypothetical protein
MNQRTLDILDQSLTCSLWAFLVCFLITLLFIALQLRTRRRGLAVFFREEFEKQYQRKFGEQELNEQINTYSPLSNRMHMAFQALLLSAGVALVFFLVVSFVPIALFDNFASDNTWKNTPLRVTSLHYNRFHEGFSLHGEVWNQTQEAISGLRAIISIWKSDRELLDTVSVPVEPDPIASESPGTFDIRYEESSPFLFGYQVTFESSEGQAVSHVEGFDVD